jgi:hypothetical protein
MSSREYARFGLLTLLKTPDNPGGLPIKVFDETAHSVQADLSQTCKELKYTILRRLGPNANISEGVRNSFWLQGDDGAFLLHISASRPSPKRIPAKA